MSIEQKQKFLRESVMKENLDKESFVHYMEQDQEKGADLDNYELEELEEKVRKFKELYPPVSGPQETEGPVLKNLPNPTREDIERRETANGKKDMAVDDDDEPDGEEGKTPKADAEDELEKESRFYGRKDCIKLDATELTTEEPVCAKVVDLSKTKAGAPRGENTIYSIETSPLKWKVNRTFKDFQWLYKSLNGKYPANFIPTLPKKKSKRTEEEVQRERLVSLQLFLSQVLQSREFRYSVDLLKFLKEGDGAFKSYSENHGKAKLIPKPKKFIEKGVASLTIDQVENSKGFVELKMDPAIRKMSRELTKMNQSLVPYIGQAIDLSREVVGQLDKTADSMNKLGLVCANIHKCFKSVGDKFDFESLSRIETIYAELHKTFTAYSKIVQDEKENFSTNVENFFAFSACEIEGIDELLTLRNEFSIEYKEKRQLLEAKKEAAHPLLDMKKWEVDQDSLPVPKTQLLADKQTALKYMFPKDTQDVKNLRDFWAYCNAQISSELREYGLMKIKRMNDQIGQYIEGFNSKINRTLTIYIDLQTRMMTV